ncbi:MAG TPA: GSCFA domain-containing protein [Rhizomicrobium sp.]|nr:GSCFA domain-containing protein [Rhizomicrobium sp.]
MAEIELEDAIARSAANRGARWPERGAANRLEPECWPELKPGFTLKPGSRVFTIGSCFARNVEHNLAALGFDVPARKFLDRNAGIKGAGGDEILNKYTPPSIWQELAWTKAIRDRDGEVREEDVEPLLLRLDDGTVVDMQHRLTNRYGVPRSQAVEQRRALYRLFENAFVSETVIVTLGLIECWIDRATGQYVEFGHYMRKHNAGGRFAFKRLTFAEALDYTRRALDLLFADGPRNLLITTSPVPLARTFTSDDVIVANAYSKSVLRAVAGQIAEEYPSVDYFPSYESAMLTKESYVWANDLTHVEAEFVGRIVGRMVEHYVASGEGLPDAAAMDRWLSFSNLVNHRRFDEAAKIFATLDPEEKGFAPRFALPLAEMHLHLGRRDAALVHAEQARVQAEAAGERGCFTLLRCAKVLDAAGHADEAEAIRARTVAALANPGLIMSLMRRLSAPDSAADFARVIAHVETRLGDNLDLLAFAVMTLEAQGDLKGAQRVCRAAIAAHPQNADMQARMGHILAKRGRKARATTFLQTAVDLDPGNEAALRKLLDLHLEAEDFDAAQAAARALVALAPDDAAAHLNLASALRRGGRREEALAHARRAAELAPENPRYSRYVEEIVKARAKR